MMEPPPSDWLDFWRLHFLIDFFIFGFAASVTNRWSLLIPSVACAALGGLLYLAQHLLWVP